MALRIPIGEKLIYTSSLSVDGCKARVARLNGLEHRYWQQGPIRTRVSGSEFEIWKSIAPEPGKSVPSALGLTGSVYKGPRGTTVELRIEILWWTILVGAGAIALFLFANIWTVGVSWLHLAPHDDFSDFTLGCIVVTSGVGFFGSLMQIVIEARKRSLQRIAVEELDLIVLQPSGVYENAPPY